MRHGQDRTLDLLRQDYRIRYLGTMAVIRHITDTTRQWN